ncbi:hypothetical protein GPJ56_002607 [Histomonas meleagridis]|uniref:uncharacterized protein n=1 Tax=Histomonas meleagridis TaxID=135588 RepID=UPI003559E3BF|nr:hypothetical protein GPJ56_002607 [Histomonas meleagridis]KAH0801399.1 hypothetical protein GO595_005994 [Histomonas meleagridis]
MPKVLIFLHGKNGFGTNVWFKTAIPVAESMGAEVISPSFPNPKDPKYDEWESMLLPILKENWEGNELYFVTHSMGGYFLLRFLGNFANEEWVTTIKGVILVGSSSTKRPEYMQFYDEDIKWDNVHSLPIQFVLMYSKDDPIIKEEHQILIKQKLGDKPNFEYHELDGYGHFMGKEYQEINYAIREMLK